MKVTPIGTIDHGIDGLDFYYLLKLAEDDPFTTAPEVALSYVKTEFLSRVYLNSDRPGSSFCHTVLVTPKPYSDTEFIGIAQVRYDV